MTANTETVRAAGRPSIMDNREKLAEALVAIREETDEAPSRYVTIKLADAGYLDFKEVKGEGRGRPRNVYRLSRKGRDFVRRVQAAQTVSQDQVQDQTAQEEDTVAA